MEDVDADILYRKLRKRRKKKQSGRGIAPIGSNFYKKYTKTINHLDDILFLLCYNFSIYLSVVLCPYDTYRQEYIQVRGGTKFEQEEKTDNKRCRSGRYDNCSPESGSDLV